MRHTASPHTRGLWGVRPFAALAGAQHRPPPHACLRAHPARHGSWLATDVSVPSMTCAGGGGEIVVAVAVVGGEGGGSVGRRRGCYAHHAQYQSPAGAPATINVTAGNISHSQLTRVLPLDSALPVPALILPGLGARALPHDGSATVPRG